MLFSRIYYNLNCRSKGGGGRRQSHVELVNGISLGGPEFLSALNASESVPTAHTVFGRGPENYLVVNHKSDLGRNDPPPLRRAVLTSPWADPQRRGTRTVSSEPESFLGTLYVGFDELHRLWTVTVLIERRRRLCTRVEFTFW